MDSKYILTPSGTFVNAEELYHHGIIGMKWGVRRYQNADGSLTAAGRKRYTNSDGTFNKKGEKYLAKETERLKSEKTKLENQKKTNAQLDELAKMRKANQDLEDEVNGKKKPETDETQQKKTVSNPEAYDMSNLTDKEVLDTANRLSNEDRLKDLLTKRGYNVSLDERTEIDSMIDSLSKEKKLAELQRDVEKLSAGKTEVEKQIEILTQKRDIAKLEKEIRDNTPKKENKLSKFMNSQAGQNLANKLIGAGVDAMASAMKKSGSDDKDSKDNKNKNQNNQNQNNQNQNNQNQNKPKNSNSNNDAVVDAGVNALKNALNKTVGKEATKVVKAVEKAQTKTAEKEAKQAAKELHVTVEKASKYSDASYYNSKAYEAKVDKMLAEMDDRAWDYYYEHYANK